MFKSLKQRLDALILLTVLIAFLFQLELTFLVLAQSFPQLLPFLLEWCDAILKSLALAGALLLLFEPGARAACHLSQPSPGELHGGLRISAGLLCLIQQSTVCALAQVFRFALKLAAAGLQLMAQSLQAFTLLLMLACLPLQFAALGIQPS